MFIIENKFISKLFDKDKTIGSKILERIYDPVLNFLNQEAEVLILFENLSINLLFYMYNLY